MILIFLKFVRRLGVDKLSETQKFGLGKVCDYSVLKKKNSSNNNGKNALVKVCLGETKITGNVTYSTNSFNCV